MTLADLREYAAAQLVQGHYGPAIELYRRAIESDPGHGEDYWQLGIAYLLVGEEDLSREVWLTGMTETAATEQDIATFLSLLEQAANRCLGDRHFTPARALYQAILELNPNSLPTCLSLATVLTQQGQFDEAIAFLDQAVLLDPTCVTPYLHRGQLHQSLSQWQDAIASFTQLLAMAPHHGEAIHRLADCHIRQGQWQEALLLLAQASERSPEASEIWGDLGRASLQVGQVERGIACLRQMVSQQPQYVQAYCFWVDQQTRENRADSAIQTNAAVLQALGSHHSGSNLPLLLGKLLGRQHQWEAALIPLQQAIQSTATTEAWLELGKVLTALRRYEEAIATYQQALQHDAAAAELHVALGQVLLQTQHIEGAITCGETALNLNPTSPLALMVLGTAYRLKGNWEKVLEYGKQAVQRSPNTSEAQIQMAIADAHQGNQTAAITALATITRLQPALAELTFAILQQLERQNCLDLSVPTLQNVLPVDPPQTYCETTMEWIATRESMGATFHSAPPYRVLNPASILPLKPPRSVTATIHPSFWFGDGVSLPGSFVVTLPAGRQWIDESSDVATLTPDNVLLGDLSADFPILSPGHPAQHPRRHPLLAKAKLPPPTPIQGKVAVLSGLLNDVYFHWMMDVLPRIDLLQRSGIALDEIDHFLVNSHLPFQQESLQRLGIPLSKTLEPRDYPHVQATELIVPSFPASPSWMPFWACCFLRQTFLPRAGMQGGDRFYISRGKTSTRRLINEAELLNCLEPLGFRCVTTEALSISEQATLFSQASLVIAPHGSGLTNLVFCNPGTRVIELFSPHYVYPCYWLISNWLGLDYAYLTGKVPEGYHLHQLFYNDARLEDLWIEVAELRSLLKLWL